MVFEVCPVAIMTAGLARTESGFSVDMGAGIGAGEGAGALLSPPPLPHAMREAAKAAIANS